ncbi:MAG TPA: CUAEP/CCAEP-tail radical SAM protein [Vicinamibacterales bacterium]|jgi:radical SAM superfamily enzyme YgiQ (UPF0313 family)
MKAVLISTYELGRQPFGLASPAAWLRTSGWDVVCVDTAKERLSDDLVASADLVGFHLPMHTATRMAMPIIKKIRQLNPSARVCAYGLYAPLNAEALTSIGVDRTFAGEFEQELTAWANGDARTAPDTRVPRIHFLVPDRRGLPPLDRYATLHMPDGERRLVGSTEASRGCKHLCRHCPIVPVYGGQFRIVAPDVVLADASAQIAAGARHITFGDPDFFNGPTHAVRIVEALHETHPEVTYDVTIKVEHLLKYRELLPRLADTGCAFVTSAVESIDDHVLAILDKGHTRADFIEAVHAMRAAGLVLVPTFVAFHPWLTLDDYCDLLNTLAGLDLVDEVAPIQLAIRLLVPRGSLLLDVPDVADRLDGFDPSTLTYRWSHADPRVDDLQRRVMALVGRQTTIDRRELFARISTLAHEAAGRTPPETRPARDRSTVPYLNEPWYC